MLAINAIIIKCQYWRRRGLRQTNCILIGWWKLVVIGFRQAEAVSDLIKSPGQTCHNSNSINLYTTVINHLEPVISKPQLLFMSKNRPRGSQLNLYNS